MGQRARVTVIPEKPATGKTGNLRVVTGRIRYRDSGRVKSGVVVTQDRLAYIQELQSRVAFETSELNTEWKKLRKDMLDGAAVEDGPIRAWLQETTRLRKSKSTSTSTSLIHIALQVR